MKKINFLPQHNIIRSYASSDVYAVYDSLLNLLNPFLSSDDKEKKCWIAGGAVRRMYFGESLCSSTGDIDIFFSSVQYYNEIEAGIKTVGSKYYCPELQLVSTTKFGRTYRWQGKHIQFITKAFYPDLRSVLDDFDFVCCQFGMASTGIIYAPWEAITDAENKELKIHRRGTTIQMFKRIVKYSRLGFTVPSETMMEFFDFIRKSNNDNGKNEPNKSFDLEDLTYEITSSNLNKCKQMVEELGISLYKIEISNDSYDNSCYLTFNNKEDMNLFLLAMDGSSIKQDLF